MPDKDKAAEALAKATETPVQAPSGEDGPRTVEVVDKDGNATLVSHPASLNNLVFGQGYTIKDKGQTVDQAAAFLSGKEA